jgi:hypothetical protein
VKGMCGEVEQWVLLVGGGEGGGSHGLSHQTTWLLAPTCRWLKAATGMLAACCRGNFYFVKYENANKIRKTRFIR